MATFVCLLVFGGYLYLVNEAQQKRANADLQRWAKRNGLQIVEQRRVWLGGPFGVAALGRVVYRVAAQDAQQQQKRGYARCGSDIFGIAEDDATVKWDDEWQLVNDKTRNRGATRCAFRFAACGRPFHMPRPPRRLR